MVSILLCFSVVLNAAWPTLPNQSAPLISRSHNPNVHTAMKPKGPSMWQGLLLGNGPVSSRGCQRKRDGGPALERQVSQLPPASSCCCACLLPHILRRPPRNLKKNGWTQGEGGVLQPMGGNAAQPAHRGARVGGRVEAGRHHEGRHGIDQGIHTEKPTRCGNPLGLTWDTFTNCRLCGEVKQFEGGPSHHGTHCRWCHSRIVSFARKNKQSRALEDFRQAELDEARASSLSLRAAWAAGKKAKNEAVAEKGEDEPVAKKVRY